MLFKYNQVIFYYIIKLVMTVQQNTLTGFKAPIRVFLLVMKIKYTIKKKQKLYYFGPSRIFMVFIIPTSKQSNKPD
jgi:hypothetical protein